MKKGKLNFLIIGLTIITIPMLTGCSVRAQNNDRIVLTAYNEAIPMETAFATQPTSAPTPAPTVEPTPSPTPTVTVANTDLPQLNIKGNFMAPKSLEGIDPYNDKVVALTFDDGPHPKLTDKLLKILADNDAVATFFVLGENAEKYPDVIKRMHESGNEIGTHSYSHSNLMKMTTDEVLEKEYGKTNDVLESIIGVRAMIDRPPYGSMSEERAKVIGREQIMWNVDPEDWKKEYKSTDKLIDNIFNGTNTGVKVKDGSIILSHDIHATTVDAYDAIIKKLKEQGYKFVTVTQLMQIADLRGKELSYIFNGAPTAENSKQKPTTDSEPAASSSNTEPTTSS